MPGQVPDPTPGGQPRPSAVPSLRSWPNSMPESWRVPPKSNSSAVLSLALGLGGLVLLGGAQALYSKVPPTAAVHGSILAFMLSSGASIGAVLSGFAAHRHIRTGVACGNGRASMGIAFGIVGIAWIVLLGIFALLEK